MVGAYRGFGLILLGGLATMGSADGRENRTRRPREIRIRRSTHLGRPGRRARFCGIDLRLADRCLGRATDRLS